MTAHRPLRIALTGGAGSGKSAVASRLRDKGVTVVDTDRIAREVVRPGTEGLAAMVAHFGEDILDADGELDRRRMRQRLLNDPDAKRQLESILHPRIMQELADRLAKGSGPYVVAEIPLLAESGRGDDFDLVITVEAPMTDRLARLQERDDISPSDARSLVDAQASEADRRSLADIVVDNDADLATLNLRVDRLDAELRDRAVSRSE
jgi:dephospho-CoA kinase